MVSVLNRDPDNACTRWALNASVGNFEAAPLGLNPSRLQRTIRRGKLQGLVWFHGGGASGLASFFQPDHIRELEARFRYLAFIHLHQSRLQKRVTEAFADAGIRAVLLKGAAIAPLVYPEPALRSTNDLDVLVDRSDEAAAARVLNRLGAAEHDLFPNRPASREAYHERVFVFHPTENLRLLVELHTGFAQQYRHPIDYSAWIERAVPAGDCAWRLTDADQLVHLAIHTGRELFMGPLKQLIDAHLWIMHRSLRWDDVVERARSAQAEHMVYELLRLCTEYLQTPVPQSVMVQCTPPPLSRMLFRRLHSPALGRLCRADLNQRFLECTTLLPLLTTYQQRATFVMRYTALRGQDLWLNASNAR